jgi:hypothetical protein
MMLGLPVIDLDCERVVVTRQETISEVLWCNPASWQWLHIVTPNMGLCHDVSRYKLCHTLF